MSLLNPCLNELSKKVTSADEWYPQSSQQMVIDRLP